MGTNNTLKRWADPRYQLVIQHDDEDPRCVELILTIPREGDNVLSQDDLATYYDRALREDGSDWMDLDPDVMKAELRDGIYRHITEGIRLCLSDDVKDTNRVALWHSGNAMRNAIEQIAARQFENLVHDGHVAEDGVGVWMEASA
jgi:hypothetical protein